MGHSSSMSTLIIALFFLLFSASTSTSTGSDDLRLRLQAKKLVRDLNLFPDLDLNIVIGAANSSSSADEPPNKIVEKRLRFPNVVGADSEVSVEDLGHYAGYYPIQHSHAARSVYSLLLFLCYLLFRVRLYKQLI